MGNEMHNLGENTYEVVEEAHDAKANEETFDDYLRARDMPR